MSFLFREVYTEATLGELDVIRNEMVAKSSTPFEQESLKDVWRAKETVWNLVNRVELITPHLMSRFGTYYGSKAMDAIENNAGCPMASLCQILKTVFWYHFPIFSHDNSNNLNEAMFSP